MVKKFPWKRARLECHRCGVLVEPVIITFGGQEVRGWRCPKCGEEILHPQDAQLAFELSKRKTIEARVSRVGRQTIIRIPATIRDYYGLDKVDKVALKPKSPKELIVKIK